MNSTAQTVSASQAIAAPAARPGFDRRLVLDALRRMPHGRLHLEFPDGTQLELGAATADAADWHRTTKAHGARAIATHAVIRVRDERFFERTVLFGDIGFSEGYLDSDWDSPDITAVIAWFILNIDHAPTLSGSRTKAAGLNLLRLGNRLAHLVRPNSRRTATRNIREHYDLSNDFFRLWLDESMMYSGARWTFADMTLADAQHEKNETLCTKLQLRPDDRVLEIGTGWGGWSIHAASRYKCRVTSLTISQQQLDLARQRVADAGLADRIEVRLLDYRDLSAGERFDKVVSIEMLEAVGHRYLDDWCRVVSRALKPSGLLACQLITCPDSRYDQFRHGVDFIQKHIFPGSLLLSVNRFNDLLARRGGFALHGLEDMGQDYTRTLRAWRANFEARLDAVRALGFDERFTRKWRYYLAYCEAAFAMRNISVVQTVHTRANNIGFA